MGETETVPGLSGWNPNSARAPMRAAAIPASEISKAMPGGGSCNRDLRRSRSIGPPGQKPDAETQRRRESRKKKEEMKTTRSLYFPFLSLDLLCVSASLRQSAD